MKIEKLVDFSAHKHFWNAPWYYRILEQHLYNAGLKIYDRLCLIYCL